MAGLLYPTLWRIDGLPESDQVGQILLSTERGFGQETPRQVVAAVADLEASHASNSHDHEHLAQEAPAAISQLTTES